jgi:hypothetical protein
MTWLCAGGPCGCSARDYQALRIGGLTDGADGALTPRDELPLPVFQAAHVWALV